MRSVLRAVAGVRVVKRRPVAGVDLRVVERLLAPERARAQCIVAVGAGATEVAVPHRGEEVATLRPALGDLGPEVQRVLDLVGRVVNPDRVARAAEPCARDAIVAELELAFGRSTGRIPGSRNPDPALTLSGTELRVDRDDLNLLVGLDEDGPASLDLGARGCRELVGGGKAGDEERCDDVHGACS